MLLFEMSQPVKLSNQLVTDARGIGQLTQRSIAGQVEFWARLGQSVEPLLRGDRVLALQSRDSVRSLSDAIAEVDAPEGKRRLQDYLEKRPFPHFEACPDDAKLLIKIDEDGSRTRGRFVNREFVTAD